MKSLGEDPFDEPDNLYEIFSDAIGVGICFFTTITFIDRNFNDFFKVDSTPK